MIPVEKKKTQVWQLMVVSVHFASSYIKSPLVKRKRKKLDVFSVNVLETDSTCLTRLVVAASERVCTSCEQSTIRPFWGVIN